MADARTVANRFLTLAQERGDTLTPMQLLKLAYIANGWMLGLHGRALFHDPVEAWQYGPVIPSLYNQLRTYRGQPVTGLLRERNNVTPLDNVEDDLIRQVYDIYGRLSGIQLSRMTHAPGTPWALTYQPGEFSVEIPIDLIEEHYRELAETRPERQRA